MSLIFPQSLLGDVIEGTVSEDCDTSLLHFLSYQLDGTIVSIKILQCASNNAVFFHLHNEAAYPATHTVF
jgi:hypothetical protein